MNTNTQRLRRQEERVPKLAKQATLRAYKQALKAGLTVTSVQRGEIVRITKTENGIEVVRTGHVVKAPRKVAKRRFLIPE